MSRLCFLAAALLLFSCTPLQQDFVAEAKPSPRMERGLFVASDGALLPLRSWLPQQKPKAVVIALHGFNDYSKAFETVGPYFARRGMAFYAYDQRGFGASIQPGIWAGRQNLIRDVSDMAQLVRRKHRGMPLVVMGESMGAAVALVAVKDGQLAADKLVLSAPAIWGGSNMNLLYRTTLAISAHVAPGWQLTGSDLKIQATDNIPLLRQMSLDPLIIKSTRLDAVYGLVGLMGDAFEALTAVSPQVLLLYGGNDQVIPPSSIEVALARFPKPLTFAYYPEGYHMLLRDLAGERVMADIAHWIRLGGHQLPSGMAKEVDPATAK